MASTEKSIFSNQNLHKTKKDNVTVRRQGGMKKKATITQVQVNSDTKVPEEGSSSSAIPVQYDQKLELTNQLEVASEKFQNQLDLLIKSGKNYHQQQMILKLNQLSDDTQKVINDQDDINFLSPNPQPKNSKKDPKKKNQKIQTEKSHFLKTEENRNLLQLESIPENSKKVEQNSQDVDVEQLNEKKYYQDEIENLKSLVNQLCLENQNLKQNFKEGNDRLSNQISELQVSLKNQQEKNFILEQRENSLPKIPRGFQGFEILQNKQIVNLRQFRNLLAVGQVRNVTLNLTQDDFNEKGRIKFEISKQQVIKGLTVNAFGFKNGNNLFFDIDCSITFQNCEFNQVQVIVNCPFPLDNSKTVLHQEVVLENIICRNTEFDFAGCLTIWCVRKLVATNISVENQKGWIGLWLFNCAKVQLQQALADSCGGTGISIFGCDEVSVRDSSCTNCTDAGCRWVNSRGNMINCNVERCSTGIQLQRAKIFKDYSCEFTQNEQDFVVGEGSEWLMKPFQNPAA